MSQDAVKMHVFLQFIFDVEKLKEFVRPLWIELYDHTYVDEKIIGGIEENLGNVAEILAQVEKRATGHVTSTLTQSSFSAAMAKGSTGDESMMKTLLDDEPKKKEPTKQQPFNLTKPKPKKIPEPEPMKREVKANPVPKHIFKKTLEDIE